MNSCRTLLNAVLLLALATGVTAQADPPPQQNQENRQQQREASPCPQVAIQTPTPKVIREGQPVTFNARINGGDRNVTPSILWNISGGAIRDGQGTPRVDIDSAGAGAYREIIAELWLGGYPAECVIQPAPYRIEVVPPAFKIDEFGQLTADEENEKLTAAVKAAQYGNDRVYVIGYAGRNSERMFSSTALRRMRDQLIRSGLTAARVSAYDGGFREQPALELWIVPEGAEPPKATPTIDGKEIVYPPTTRTRPASVRKP